MPSATREALQRARAALSEHALDADGGGQLLVAARAVTGSPQLRGLLTDPSSTPSDRQRAADRVFAPLSAEVRRLIGAVVGSRWSSPGDLVSALEELGIRAIAGTASADVRLEEELFQISTAVASDPQLELALNSKLVGADPKLRLIDTLLTGRVSGQTLAIVRHLVQRPKRQRVTESLRWATGIVADASGFLVATATSATPLPEAQVARLERALSAQYGRRVRVNPVIDPAVLGGIRVQLGDDVIDGTVASRLADLRLQLAG